ncbi:hypothetical protein [Williamsia sp. 1135]|nr:hypothetical protein [Williamsia sp. 1135]
MSIIPVSVADELAVALEMLDTRTPEAAAKLGKFYYESERRARDSET